MAPASLAGVFVPREQATGRRPDVMRAWFGMDSAALAAHGVRAGLAVTGYKRGERLAATRFTGRALDDRAGDTALLLALAGMNPARLNHKVIFVWSVEEELEASAHGRSLTASEHRRIMRMRSTRSCHPIRRWSHPSSPSRDSGHGPVLIAMDDETIVLPAERERILALGAQQPDPIAGWHDQRRQRRWSFCLVGRNRRAAGLAGTVQPLARRSVGSQRFEIVGRVGTRVGAVAPRARWIHESH